MLSYTHSNYSSNKGSALAIGLIILTSITLISITSLQRSGLQGRMVGSIQHQEQGFNAAHSELEEIYHFYATQPTVTDALSAPLNSFDMVNGDQIFTAIAPGHETTTTIEDEQSAYEQSDHLDVSSDIQHTGIRNALVEGFSIGTFIEYGFVVSSQSREPSLGQNPGRSLSSQLIGINFIAPAG